jgi:hypothetical protein
LTCIRLTLLLLEKPLLLLNLFPKLADSLLQFLLLPLGLFNRIAPAQLDLVSLVPPNIKQERRGSVISTQMRQLLSSTTKEIDSLERACAPELGREIGFAPIFSTHGRAAAAANFAADCRCRAGLKG